MQPHLFDLPQDILVRALCRWISLEDLVALDTALCSRSFRPSFLEALQSKGFAPDLLSCKSEENRVMQWIIVRNVNVRMVRLGRHSDLEPAIAAMFLECIGPNLRDLSIRGAGGHLVFICAMAIVLCTHLRVLHLYDCDEDDELTVRSLIARRAPTLECLALEDVRGNVALPRDCAMPKLQDLVLTHSPVCVWELGEFVSNCRNLLFLHCDELVSDDVLYALAQSCPSLASLHYGYEEAYKAHRAGVAALEAVLLACKELHTVDFTSSHGFTNAHVTSVAQHCSKLKAMQFRFDRRGIREKSISTLAPRIPELRYLSLVSLRCSSVVPLQTLAERGGFLRSLGLRGLRVPGNASESLVALFSALSSMQELDLSYVQGLSDSVLVSIGKTCTALHTLDIYKASDFTMEGVAAAVQGC